MKLSEVFPEASMLPALRAHDKGAILLELGERLSEVHEGIAAAPVVAALRERESLASTAIGEGVAIPHGRVETARRVVGAIGRSVEGVAFDSVDAGPTHLFFAVIAPTGERDQILAVLGRLSRLLRAQPQVKSGLLAARGPAEMFAALAAAEEQIGS